jgi:hypothetical protein
MRRTRIEVAAVNTPFWESPGNKGIEEAVIASDSEAIQTEPADAQPKSGLLRFARNDG